MPNLSVFNHVKFKITYLHNLLFNNLNNKNKAVSTAYIIKNACNTVAVANLAIIKFKCNHLLIP